MGCAAIIINPAGISIAVKVAHLEQEFIFHWHLSYPTCFRSCRIRAAAAVEFDPSIEDSELIASAFPLQDYSQHDRELF